MSRVSFLLATALLLLGTVFARAGEVLDRIVAKVNGHIILQSDWQDALRFDAFVDNRPLDQLSADDRKAALDRLIDQELLREQMRSSDFQHATAAAVDRRIAGIRTEYSDEEGWQAALARYGLTEQEVRERVTLQLDLMQLVDAHLRPTVNIDAASIESYYNQELLPQLRQSGAKQPALSEVTPKIKEVLTQQKVNQLLVAWLQSLRSGSEIQTQPGSADSGGQVQ